VSSTDCGPQPFLTLAISRQWNALNERLCATLAQQVGAERAIIAGVGHGVQRTGPPICIKLRL